MEIDRSAPQAARDTGKSKPQSASKIFFIPAPHLLSIKIRGNLYEQPQKHHRTEQDKQLQKLGVVYVDFYLLHDILQKLYLA